MAPLRTFEGRASIAGSVPSAAVDTGQAARALAEVGAGLSQQLGQMADRAAAREGELAGLEAGQKAGAGFLERRAAEARAGARQTQLPADISSIITQAAHKHGVSPETLAMIADIESGGDPNAKNPNSSAAGLFQFVQGTAKAYGLTNPYDAAAAADAGARFLRDNEQLLTKRLGRAPTPGELYLAHQQGAEGAAKLLLNPDAPAASIVGGNAVLGNGGSEGMTAAAFAAKWLRRAGGETPIANAEAPLDVRPLQLRNDLTIRGEAFNAAATRAWTWRLQTGLNQDLAQAAIDNPDNPAEYEQAAVEIRQKYLTEAGINDPRAREAFDAIFADRTASDRITILATRERKQREQEIADATAGIEASRADLERQAFNLGANAGGDALIERQANRQVAAIDNAIADGIISPAAGLQQKDAIWQSAARGRIMGVFEALPTPEQQESYALDLLDQWSEGKGTIGRMSLDQVKALSSQLYAEARAGMAKKDAVDKVQLARVEDLVADDLASLAATGRGVDLAAEGLDIAGVTAVLGPEKAAAWQKQREVSRQLYEATAGMELESEDQIRSRLDELVPKPGQPGYVDAAYVLEVAQKRAEAIFTERANDPAVLAQEKVDIVRYQKLIEDDVASRAATGAGIDLAAEKVDLARMTELLGPDIVYGWQQQQQLAQQVYAATQGIETESPEQIAARLAALAPVAGDPGFTDQQDVLELTRKRAEAVLTERETDPLGQAARAGLVEVPPLALDSYDAMIQSMTARREAAATVSQVYGTPPTVFRPEERTALARAFATNPELLPGFAMSVTETFGTLAPQALSELSEAGPELAHVAGVVQATGDPSIARDVADVLARRAQGAAKVKLPSDNRLADAAGQIFGPAFAMAPDGRSAVLGTAALLLEQEATLFGFDPDQVGKSDSPAAAAYARVLDRALGARFVNGVKWGGVTEINGLPTIAPSFMPAEQVAPLLSRIEDRDLTRLAPIAAANGVPVRAAELRQGHLVPVGDGQYRVALGDPQGFDPQWLATPEGDYWTLDLEQLQQIDAARKPMFEFGLFGAGRINPEVLQ